MWTRYGRVGVNGVSDNAEVYSKDKLIKDFLKTEKLKKRKGYNEIKMSLGTTIKPVVKEDKSD